MKPRLLVATSVHPPDDPRIRERLIRALAPDFEITYATPAPGPADRDGIDVVVLAGDRAQRRREVRRLLLAGDYDVAVAHDPELLPAALAATRRGHTVVFDLHEDVPAQLRVRSSTPPLLRRPLARVAATYIRHAERRIPFTLAEPGYARMLKEDHPVFPNYPRYDTFPPPGGNPSGPVVYVGDVTVVRGALTLVEAMGLGPPDTSLVLVGRCADDLRSTLLERAHTLGVDVELRGWLPHTDAMEVVRDASVGVSPLHDVPNYRHSLPTKTLEYLALGVPTVATDLPGTRAAIGDLAGVVLVQPNNATALGDGIARARTPGVRDAAFSAVPGVREAFVWPDGAVRDFYGSLRA